MQIIDSPGKRQTQQERFEKTRTLIYPDSGQACRELAAEVAVLIREREGSGERAVLGLATGSTPVPFYRELIRLHREEGLSFAKVVTFNLDEYYGLGPDHPESYARFMRDQLFDHIDIPAENINIPNGTVPLDRVYESCLAYEAKIQAAGGIDLQILGIGRTGHIGFNEPGSSRDSLTRMITLDRVTRLDAAPDFLGVQNVPRYAVTMGVGTILAARRLVLMAWGDNKAEIVRQAVEDAVTDQVSASFLQEHAGATFLVDAAAASRLTRRRLPWLTGSVNWDDAMERRSVLWLAKKLGKPVLKLVDEEYNENGAGELLTAAGRAYQVNIRVFNRLQHTITGWPGGKPDADDANRPERAQPFPKRVLILSPEPHDAIVGMGGTLERLVEQGHEVRLATQTSGNLRVSDVAAYKFASLVLEMAEGFGGSEWEGQEAYAKGILRQMEEKGEFGADPENVRKLKGLVLRGEARDAAKLFGIEHDALRFLDLPFYEKGRYRRFRLGDEDIEITRAMADEFRPHQIYVTGNVADPSSLDALCFQAFQTAVAQLDEAGADWLADCRFWLYRGKERPMEAHEISMAVPMSPDQLASKNEAMRKFQSINPEEIQTTERNREIAREYDALGMAEYEAIEAFQRWKRRGAA
ncbi:MAG: glucosamine-6-phosphate deaminase [Verrucomicrobiae bacterium]|nr:glucosamine-6-phosphate deaminase [Verrucomicrobiae bacterium]MCP5541722.1 glucosamine-6-phosphate deaminase [Akkermansiaceae bacterium]MCP5551751.1 glucosamine-6-phosphate deaminase [Akkermansiaceae bacterium]